MQRIFILEDDENIRELVLYALKPEFSAAGFSCPAEFWQAIKTEIPGLLLLDIMLPEENGISILKQLKSSSRTRSLPVILLTAKTDEYDRVKGLDTGADDYITKPFSVLELVSRVRAVLRRSAPTDDITERLKIGSVTMYPDRRVVTVNDENISLTYKEFELLQYLMDNRDTVLSRDRIMSQVWGTDIEIETRTVDMHIKTLRQKLGPGGDIIRTIRGVGYKVGD